MHAPCLTPSHLKNPRSGSPLPPSPSLGSRCPPSLLRRSPSFWNPLLLPAAHLCLHVPATLKTAPCPLMELTEEATGLLCLPLRAPAPLGSCILKHPQPPSPPRRSPVLVSGRISAVFPINPRWPGLGQSSLKWSSCDPAASLKSADDLLYNHLMVENQQQTRRLWECWWPYPVPSPSLRRAVV